MHPSLTRRNFLKTATLAASALPAARTAAGAALEPATPTGAFGGKLCFFSKALPTMDWRRMSQNLKRLGFDGVDLTVRPEGHVLPERAAEDLPKAFEAIRAEGLEVPMITTALLSADDPAARSILSTAGKLGIPYLKPGYYLYELVNVEEELEGAAVKFRSLVKLASENGVQVGYHNHEEYIGAPVWDMARVIEPLDAKWVGYYFDVRHATAEGGVGVWKISTNLVSHRLKMLAVKDFAWRKTPKRWLDDNCPLGEGMVNWKSYFAMIAKTGFQGPVSLHLEYEIPGASREEKEQNTLAAAARDFQFLKARIREAYGEA